jgi:C4-dicarboxylate-specific signal transduction histidine kinase
MAVTGREEEEGGKKLYRLALVDMTERKRMEEEFRRSRDDLEMRVRERTADLVQAKQTLEAEVSERRSASLLRTLNKAPFLPASLLLRCS